MDPSNAGQALARSPWRFLTSRWPWLALLYLLLSAVIGLVMLPLAVLTLLFVPLWGILIGAVERRRTRLLGFPPQRSGHVRVIREERHNWLGVRLTEAATWRETGALLSDVVLGLLSFVLLLFEALSLFLLLSLGFIGSQRRADVNLFGDVHLVVDQSTWWSVIPVGIVLLPLFGYLNALLATGHALMLRALCGPREEELSRNVERLTRSRAALVQAFEDERRRIERDLHDGVQQELVTLAARLGMVSLELDELADRNAETTAARHALEAAQDQAEHAMATLRRTVRGIHPAVLTDHGLRAALDELADRTPVPLELDITSLSRVAPAIETAAYYLVTEAITNAAKHTAASRVHVRAQVASSTVDVTVTDNGHGGAREEAGTGLRGLRERVETLGGSFDLVSPAGGPTQLHMSVPLKGEGRHDAHTAR
ncbi:sensor histidine kinase [Microbacterium murale]|uniref:histidine kinase n=1 Tax=Microbacterium murale TaxID=1081040 RepID=A0ABU0PEI1_9MICO|nr:sensor histidine kinase [Microbacterium murale]MDQ0645740.1 signal transduction histidine kinase [Microbacterium murale]